MIRRVAWPVLAVALGGCAVAPVAPPPAATDVQGLSQWSATGRMAVAANGEGGSGSFTWAQDGASTTLSIRGPLGAGAMQITSDGQSLDVTDADGRHLGTEQARALLRQRIGMDLPLAELRWWMLGTPSPAPSPSATLQDAPEAPLRVIEQSGWRIAYDSFQSTRMGSLPARFAVSQGDVRLKVIVDGWQLQAPGGGSP